MSLSKWGDDAMFPAVPMRDHGKRPGIYLLSMNADPLGSIAALARMYEGKPTYSLDDITNQERMRYFESIQHTKLQAPFEAVKLHFFIEGISRSTTHQMVRQRTATYCLSGDTTVFTIRKSRRYTLAELYEKWSAGGRGMGPLSRMKIRTVTNEGLVVYRQIKSVMQSGEKKVYELRTHDGRSIKASRDHLFWQPDGSWKRLGDLHVGGEVVSIGYKFSEEAKLNMRNAPRSRWSKEAKENFSKWCLENRGGKKPEFYTGIDVGHRTAQALFRYKKANGCYYCGDRLGKIELAHLDGDPDNNVDMNVQALCVPCHRAFDQGGYPMKTYSARIVSIHKVGAEMTYDLEMAGEFQRFVANGLVVHNSQESLRFAVKENVEVVEPPTIRGLGNSPNDQMLDTVWTNCLDTVWKAYNVLVENGIPAEDARELLPHATSTRIHYVTDLRNLVEHAGNRLCTQAVPVWREIFTGIVDAIRNYPAVDPFPVRPGDAWQFKAIADSMLFRPACYQEGKCPFDSDIDRGCTIRERVTLFAKNGVPSTEWHKDYLNDHGVLSIPAIRPEEWLLNTEAGRTHK